MFRKIEETITNELNDAYVNKKSIDNLNGISIFQEPFTHGVINNLIEDSSFIAELKKEFKSKVKYLKKNNDLYKFHQTADLMKNKSPKIETFRDKILYGELLNFLKNVTNIDLSPKKIDVTSSKYEHTDYLLCHDDDIHDVNNFGRRIAFIYYLVPDDWNEDGSDGGNLDLFKVDDNLNPTDIVKSIVPKLNSLLFFEVSDRSFHQVSEVLSKTKTRLSINGWFHGPINFRPSQVPSLPPEPSPFVNVDSDMFFEWITEKYIKPTNQSEIQLIFSSNSEIKLDNVFNKDKYEKVSNALNSKEIKWTHKGPANRRAYEVAEMKTLPDVLHDLVKILTCEYMGLTLSNMTGLRLHPSMPKSKDEDDDDEDDDDDDEDDDENDEEDEDNEDDDDEDEDENSNNDNDEDDDIVDNKKRKLADDPNESDRPCTSSSLGENSAKKFKQTDDPETVNEEKNTDESKSTETETVSDQTTSNGEKSSIQGNASSAVSSEEFTAKCYVEIRKWRRGFYTLITDDDSEIKMKALDLMMFFNCKSWSPESGGNVSYIARNEDQELLTVNPEENTLSLVYRDEETLKFTKCLNSRIDDINQDGCFYEISVIYYE